MVAAGCELASPCPYCGRLNHGFVCGRPDQYGRYVSYTTGRQFAPKEEKPPTEPPPWSTMPAVGGKTRKTQRGPEFSSPRGRRAHRRQAR